MVGGGWLWMTWPCGPVANGSIRQEFDFPSPPVDADVVMILAHQQAVFDAGGAAVFLVGDVVDVEGDALAV
jgi:hypothetical protein